MSCSDNWYTVTYYEGEWFGVLQPQRMVCVSGNTDDSQDSNTSSDLQEFVLMVKLQLFVGSALMLLVLYRSCSTKRTDMYRLVFFYLFGTVVFGAAYAFGHSIEGFTRLIGWGVMLHNVGEWFIVLRVWFGAHSQQHKNRPTDLLAVLYIFLFIIAVTVVLMAALWFIAVFQGALVDYLLVFSVWYLFRWSSAIKKERGDAGPPIKKHMCAGLCAAVLHLASIQPLFFGIATAYSPLAHIATLSILPTFVLYMYLASSGVRKLNIVRPDFDEPDLLELEHSVGELEDLLMDVQCQGLTNIDPSSRRTLKRGVGVAISLAFFNTMLVFLAPCYIDFSGLTDCQ